MRVAIQGAPGAFSHEAAHRALGPTVELVPCADFDRLFASVLSGDADRAIVPIENTLAGSVHENYDRLASHPLHNVAETRVRVRLCLVGPPGASLASVRRAASHPVALAQCRRFFAAHPEIEMVAARDTAESVRDAVAEGTPARAGIGSALAARLYGGVPLAEEIEDHPGNFTRFLVVSREPVSVSGPCKSSLMISTDHAPGALYRALGVFASLRLNLSKIESRPIMGRPWEYTFYLDVLGESQGDLAEGVAELTSVAHGVRVLGYYRPAPEE